MRHYLLSASLKQKRYYMSLTLFLYVIYCLQVLLRNSVTIATCIYATAAVLAAVACIVLPIETSGKELTDNVQQQAQANASKK